MFQKWRNYETAQKKINTLKSGKRFISDNLVEITEQQREMRISPEELQIIKAWGNLKGEPDFLGSGSKGVTYKFGDKVLKLTRDSSEAQACAAIVGKTHPNVYDVYSVGLRQDATAENFPYAIVYGFLDYPNELMTDTTELMFHKIKKSDRYYYWKPNYLNRAENLIKQLVRETARNENILGDPIGLYTSIEPKIDHIAINLGWTHEEQALFTEFWTLTIGKYNNSLNESLNVFETARKILQDPRTEYFNQLALGLTFLFENGVKFNDLKMSNIMEKAGQIAIIDIGYSQVFKKHNIEVIE